MRTVDLQTAVSAVKPDQRIFVQGGAATPHELLEELVRQKERLWNVNLIHLHTMGNALYAQPDSANHFETTSLFVGANLRNLPAATRTDYLPCFLSEIPSLFRGGILPLDAAFIHASPPDRHGYCSLGVSVDVTLAAIQSAKMIFALINPKMPRVHGDGFLPASEIDFAVEIDRELPTDNPISLTREEKEIGKLVASLIEDGATLQAGIGSVPNAALSFLHNHKHLGVHTETWSDSMLDLIEAGAVDNSQKSIVRGKTVSTFLIGSKRLYDFIDDNPSIVQLDATFVNRPETIARNPKVVAINSAVEIDLTGQVCADSIGPRIISGVGGQMDFIRGATHSIGGKAIIALPSRTKKGIPRIVSTLRQGAGVVTTRAHVHYVITEHGIADLWGKPLHKRAKALIAIAHPEDRVCLEKEWAEICLR